MPENSAKAGKKRRATRTSWQPGQSGNPGGRPRKTPELREVEELARRASPTAIKRLTDIVRNGKDADAVRASQVILERAFGPTQQQKSLDAQDAPPVEFKVILSKDKNDEPHPKELASGAVLDAEIQCAASLGPTESAAPSSAGKNGQRW